MSGAAEGDPVSISAVEIRKIRGADTIDLRHRVMWPDKPKSHVVLPDDASATHFGSFVGGALIGVASFFPDGKVYRLRKLAVDEAFQSRGVASALIAHACGHLRELGSTQIWCDARVSARGFYARNGFKIEVGSFQKHGLDYVIARREI